MPKKGVSADEKRKRLEEMFHEKKDFFQLKEVEKFASKEKGIVLQSVQEVLQQLLDDGLVEKDKIGTSVYYWSFPSTALQKRKNVLEAAAKELAEYKKQKQALGVRVVEMRASRKESAQRTALLKQLAAVEAKHAELTAELAKYAENDPEAVRVMEEQADIARDAANRWTDNIEAALKWCAERFQRTPGELREGLGIPETLDYLE